MNSEPYNEKADIWAAGCILYQMAMLQPPFQSGNVLALAKKVSASKIIIRTSIIAVYMCNAIECVLTWWHKIAEVAYAHLPTGLYSDKVTQVIERYCDTKLCFALTF